MKDERLQLRLDGITRNLLDELARRQKMNVSEWIRSVILEYTSLKKDASTAKNHAEQLVKMEKYIDQREELLKRYEEQPKLTELFERYKGQIMEGTLIRHKADLVHLMANQTMVELSKETKDTETKELLPTVQLKASTPVSLSQSPLSEEVPTSPNVSGWLPGHWIWLIGIATLLGAVFFWRWTTIIGKSQKNEEQLPVSKDSAGTAVRSFGRQSIA
ncbi:ribbon-helix-helix domain-containing protein [Runella salmonicolor]|uniref:Ribbon-helix-helix domain-containing protein n=1 Tax=Runella salmonicolor TaxID=2950278 RepID=A0ABT1FX84_9BACT|nr:CopG family transcriptional regulator [Runella salmonicolor]MCP1386384.1 ribbon-helix-helix domain-containing protein [Runella salmonicolor]